MSHARFAGLLPMTDSLSPSRQLGGLDAVFLYFETDQTPMHVAGLTLYEVAEPEKSFHETFSSFFQGRVHLIPIFQKKLARTVFQLDHPGWVDAGTLDFDYHIKGARLPSPGSRAQLEDWVAAEHAKPLDRTKPLWQFTVIEGLEPGPDGKTQAALYSKVHHAAIDGGAGMVITQALYDLGPVPRDVGAPLPEPKSTARIPTLAERAVLGLHDLTANLVRQQMNALETVPKIMGAALDAVESYVDPDKKVAMPTFGLAPKTPFNATMGRGRSYATRTLPLSGAKAIGKASGAKLNDVVMAICSGMLRRYLSEVDRIPSRPLVAFVPVSAREAGDTTLNNQVLAMNVPLATNIADPVERLAKIAESSAGWKDAVSATKDVASGATDYTLIGAPTLLPGMMQLYGRSGLADVLPSAVNLAISNTMGPPFPLYCNGSKVTHLYPVSIATHGVGLNITVQSYLDGLDFGITAGAKAVPDARRMTALLEEAYAELHDALVPPPADAPPARKPRAVKDAPTAKAKPLPKKAAPKSGAVAKTKPRAAKPKKTGPAAEPGA
ncbi:wax ester/triacylglycerol synthase family O-acyltransferase [Rhizobiaceae bacterium]|nr:wax ester/triacylglycerol synthase family O-acyltransferase [Rhizobiaceae bacterium]